MLINQHEATSSLYLHSTQPPEKKKNFRLVGLPDWKQGVFCPSVFKNFFFRGYMTAIRRSVSAKA